MAIRSFKRYEKKFLLNAEQFKTLIPKLIIYMNPDEYCKSGRNYNIYIIYYDTSNNDVIRNSISGPYYKEKLRLRSYFIPSNLNDKVFLELKKKINGIINKRRVILTLVEIIKTKDFGALFELTYKISLKPDANQKKFIDDLRCRNGDLNINLTLSGFNEKVYG